MRVISTLYPPWRAEHLSDGPGAFDGEGWYAVRSVRTGVDGLVVSFHGPFPFLDHAEAWCAAANQPDPAPDVTVEAKP